MSAYKPRPVLSSRVRVRKFVQSVGFPRSIVALGLLLVGSALLMASLLEPNGTLRQPGLREVFYSATLIATAVVIVFLDLDGCRRLLRRGRRAVRRRT
jgi:hypothetical protein